MHALRMRTDLARYPLIDWRWRVLQAPGQLDPRVHTRGKTSAQYGNTIFRVR
jgi:hypothetical protein